MQRFVTFLRASAVFALARWAKPQRWGLTIAIAALIGNLALLYVMPEVKAIGDGTYSWLYARSLAYDHDIDFKNDYALCGDEAKRGVDRGGGHLDNPFYLGPALFWVPAIEVARVLHPFPPNTKESTAKGCDGPIVAEVLHIGAFLGALVVWLSYLAARRLAGDYVAAVSAGLFAFGTTLSAYSTYEAGYSHVSEGVCVAALVVLSLRAYEEPDRILRWALAGLALAAAALHRPTDLPLGLIPLGFAVLALRSRRAQLVAAITALCATTVAFGVAPLLLVYRYLYGHSFGVVPQGQYFLHPTHPHVWLVLFAPKGLFFFAPVAWVSVVGVVLALGNGAARARLGVVFVAFAIQLYLVSIPIDWDASSTIGARRLLPMIPLLALFATVAVERARRWFTFRRGRRRALVTALFFTPLAFVFLGEAAYYAEPRHPQNYYASQEELYGNGFRASWRALDLHLGALALLPAQAVFSLRYRLPQTAYWDSTYVEYYKRDYRTLKFRKARIRLTDEHLKLGMTGFVHNKQGLAIVRPHATLVFATEWPYATHLDVVGRADKPVTVYVSSRSFFGSRRSFGSVRLDRTESTTRLKIPRGAYESGMQELSFDTGDVRARVELTSIELVDTATYAPFR